MKILISFLLLCSVNAYSQDMDCEKQVLKKHDILPRDASKTDSSNLVLFIKVWGHATNQDLANYWQNKLPESDFNCLVKPHSLKRDIVLVVDISKRRNSKIVATKKQAFDFDVWRALVYQN